MSDKERQESHVSVAADSGPEPSHDSPQIDDTKADSGAGFLNVQIDDLNCSGCEDCVDSLPNVFEMTDDGETARVKMTRIPAELEDDIREAMDDCPGDAISIE